MCAEAAEKVFVQNNQNLSDDVNLVPYQCTQFATLNGTDMALTLTNLSPQNLAEWTAASSGSKCVEPGSGQIPPYGQKTFAPCDFHGTPLVVCNVTNPNKPANIRVLLKGVKS